VISRTSFITKHPGRLEPDQLAVADRDRAGAAVTEPLKRVDMGFRTALRWRQQRGPSDRASEAGRDEFRGGADVTALEPLDRERRTARQPAIDHGSSLRLRSCQHRPPSLPVPADRSLSATGRLAPGS
jgi:hypothetical protein